MRGALGASIAARGFAALLGLLALPLYLSSLGVEAWGVVGLFASLQVLVGFMDLGLPATLTRQLAADWGDPARRPEARDLVRTCEWVYLVLAALVAVSLVLLVPWVASHWVNRNSLSVEEVARPLQLAALSLACAWPANLYSAGMEGLHRQVALAFSATFFAVLRVAATVLFLWLAPTLESFFWAQFLTSVLQSAGTRVLLWRALAMPAHRPAVRWPLLARSRRFAGGMTVITVTSILLSQVDKVILSHVLPLPEFGAYAVAGSLAAGLYILIGPLFSVNYPHFSALWAARDEALLADFFHASSQALALLVLPIAAVLAWAPEAALFVLTNDRAISAQAAPALVWMVVAAACNGLYNMPFALQLAAGWTRLTVWVNLAALTLMLPATWWGAVLWGAPGGAAAWAGLNVLTLAVAPQLLHRRLLPGEKWRWYAADILVPALASVGSTWFVATIWPVTTESRLLGALQLAGYWLVVMPVTLLSLGRMRRHAAIMLRR